MLKSWQGIAKKPSLVVVVVDSSGSMEGEKLPAVQRTLQTYINSLGTQKQQQAVFVQYGFRSTNIGLTQLAYFPCRVL